MAACILAPLSPFKAKFLGLRLYTDVCLVHYAWEWSGFPPHSFTFYIKKMKITWLMAPILKGWLMTRTVSELVINNRSEFAHPNEYYISGVLLIGCCSVTQLFLNLCNLLDCSTPGSPDLHYLLEFADSTDSCLLSRWCHPTISSCCLLLLPSIFPSISIFSNESALPTGWSKY